MRKLSLILLLVLGLVGIYALPTEAQGSIDIEPPDGWLIKDQDETSIYLTTPVYAVGVFPESGQASIRIMANDGNDAWALDGDDNLAAVIGYQYGMIYTLAATQAAQDGTLHVVSSQPEPELLFNPDIDAYLLFGHTLSDHALYLTKDYLIVFSCGLGELSNYQEAIADVISQISAE